MKKLLTVLLILSMILSFSACGQAANGGEKAIKIGIAAPDVTHGWVAGVAYYAEKYCKENNITYKTVTSSDAAEMAAGLDDLVAWGASAIVTFPQWEGMESAIGEIIAKNIPVVSFDIDVPAEGIYKVTGDNYGMGYESARYITNLTGDAARILVLDVPSLGSVSAQRKQGFYDYLTEAGYDTSNVYELSCTAYTREEGLRNMSDTLLVNQTVDAVFAQDDELAIGCIQAITESGRTDIKAITGGGGMQDYFKMIADEKYASLNLASALYSPIMVQDAVIKAVKLCKGEEVDAVSVISTAIVSSENVSDYLDEENTIY